MELKVNQTPPSLPTVCIGDSTERLQGNRKEVMDSIWGQQRLQGHRT